MEQEGIYYYFKHEDSKHTLVLADSYSAHNPVAGYAQVPYYPPDETALRERDHIQDWSVVRAVRHLYPHRLRLHSPAQEPADQADSPQCPGEQYARVRMKAIHAGYETARGAGNARGIATGALFTLTGYPRQDQNREYLIVSADYQLESDASGSSIVVGKAGEEIWTGSTRTVTANPMSTAPAGYVSPSPGPVKAGGPSPFRASVRKSSSSSWKAIPTSPSSPAGSTMTSTSHPTNYPPAPSSADSNPTAPRGGYNEYAMDDTKGNELIRKHGQFDKDSTIEHDLRENVPNDRSRDVTNNETIQVGNDHPKTIGNNETTSIGVDRTETVGNNETITIGSNRSEHVGANENVTVALTRTHNVGVNDMLNVGGANEITVGGLQALTVGGLQAMTVALDPRGNRRQEPKCHDRH